MNNEIITAEEAWHRLYGMGCKVNRNTILRWCRNRLYGIKAVKVAQVWEVQADCLGDVFSNWRRGNIHPENARATVNLEKRELRGVMGWKSLAAQGAALQRVAVEVNRPTAGGI